MSFFLILTSYLSHVLRFFIFTHIFSCLWFALCIKKVCHQPLSTSFLWIFPLCFMRVTKTFLFPLLAIIKSCFWLLNAQRPCKSFFLIQEKKVWKSDRNKRPNESLSNALFQAKMCHDKIAYEIFWGFSVLLFHFCNGVDYNGRGNYNRDFPQVCNFCPST